jgi:integrase
MNETTYDVRVYKTEVYKGAKVTTHWVRWKTGEKTWKEPYRTTAQADSFRSSLVTAAREGQAFNITTGRPLSWQRDETKAQVAPTVSWYALTLDYTAAKWKYASPNHRRSIAEALTDATEVLFASEPPYERAEIRRALATWAYSARLRDQTPHSDIAPVIGWLETATIPVTELADPDNGRARAVLDRISSTQQGKLAAANTANRKRTVLNNLMKYAIIERKLKAVDPRCVINPAQARRFLTAAGQLSPRGKRLRAFFGCMYYAAMRPEETTDLRDTNLAYLPEKDGEWGEFLLTNSQPRSGSQWTDDGSVRERRELKHRAKDETRTVPMHPELARILRDHINEFGIAPGGRIFQLAAGGIVTDRAYLAVFHKARTAAFTETEARSLLARRPYDLRHAAVSTWLNAGVGPPQVADWAGHSVDVLLRVYAKCISGQQDEAKRRILDATSTSDDSTDPTGSTTNQTEEDEPNQAP